MRRGLCLLVAVAGLQAFPAQAQLRLALPVDCMPGEDCFIQNHADHDEAQGAFRDYACGDLGFDGHHGTDFRVHHTERLAGEGVNVLAAAKGVVVAQSRAVTIKEDDIPLIKLIKLGMSGRDCGEGLRIDHGSGWHTHYCHLRAGSVTVKNGERVTAGQVIGKMGETGHTEFPHLHFELWHYGIPIDPFVGHSKAYDCEPERRYSLWDEKVAAQLAYTPAGVMAAGFTAEAPQVQEIRRYGARPLTRLADTQPLGIWADTFGLREGDAIRMTLTAPDDAVLLDEEWTQAQDAAIALLWRSVPPPADGWRAGRYRAALRITRNGEALVERIWEYSKAQ